MSAYLIFLLILADISAGLGCSGPGGTLPNASYCSSRVRFTCDNADAVVCPIGCLNGICLQSEPVCTNTVRFNPNRSTLCWSLLADRSDRVDARLDYDNLSNVAAGIMIATFTNYPPLTRSCRMMAYKLACFAAFPTCDPVIYDELATYYNAAVKECAMSGTPLPQYFSDLLYTIFTPPPVSADSGEDSGADLGVDAVDVSILLIIIGMTLLLISLLMASIYLMVKVYRLLLGTNVKSVP